MPTLTNTKTQPAYYGMGVRISIDASDPAELATFETLYIGMVVDAPSGSKGTVNSIDTYGGTFLVMPEMPTASFDGSSAYKLTNGEQITLP